MVSEVEKLHLQSHFYVRTTAGDALMTYILVGTHQRKNSSVIRFKLIQSNYVNSGCVVAAIRVILTIKFFVIELQKEKIIFFFWDLKNLL